jgi:hypothetical protein
MSNATYQKKRYPEETENSKPPKRPKKEPDNSSMKIYSLKRAANGLYLLYT